MKTDNISEAEQVQQNQGGQYVPPQQYAPQAQQKSGHGYVVVIVVVVLAIFVVLPAIALIFLGGAFRDFINSSSGQDFINGIINKIDPAIEKGSYVVGKWDCKNFNGNVSKMEASEYNTSIVLNEDGTFQYGEYGDLSNNSFRGNYTSEKEEKDNPTYNYYALKFSNVSQKINGEETETQGLQPLEMGITKTNNGREAVASFSYGNMYYCYER